MHIFVDVTDQGFLRKKMLMEQIDNSGSAELKEFEDVGNKMPATLTKLFGCDRQTIKTGAAAKVAKRRIPQI